MCEHATARGECGDRLDPPSVVLSEWARRLAASFAVREPGAALGRIGVGLLARTQLLHGRGRRVLGAWDPVLRRIEIFGCDVTRPDAELVETLGHELWHLMAHARCRAVRRAQYERVGDEAVARCFAALWRQSLRATDVRACAAALRALAAAGSGADGADGGA